MSKTFHSYDLNGATNWDTNITHIVVGRKILCGNKSENVNFPVSIINATKICKNCLNKAREINLLEMINFAKRIKENDDKICQTLKQ